MRIPAAYKSRLSAAAKEHRFPTVEVLTKLLIERGLRALGTSPDSVPAQLREAVDLFGYSSEDELVEHLLERGLAAFETTDKDPEKLRARLRGLGYLD